MQRWVVIAAAALLSMSAGAITSRVAAAPLARVMARAFGWIATTLPSAPAPTAQPAPEVYLPAEPLPAEPEPEPSPAATRRAPSSVSAKPEPPRKGILVRRATVRAAVRAGIMPSAAPVPATADHPAGLLVTGIGGAGGLRDGDIVTRVGGMTPRSIEDVIGVVAGCYKHKTYSISGEFWRDGERWNAVVELPPPKNEGSAERGPRDGGTQQDDRKGEVEGRGRWVSAGRSGGRTPAAR
ncbi:MAG TPA: hypothetical protein PLI95_03580 [Polyangiaceae bacterium]|nr:hypothetical protein [Polyangiaceae bacterium]